jgi:hypothetical protein
MADGSTIERTTREWAMQLTLADRVTNARCNIVNGSKNQIVYLLAPQPHFNEMQAAFKEYRLRLNLLGERETRFRNSLPDHPSVIHVNVSTQANLDFLEHLLSEDMSRRAPALVRGGPKNSTTAPPAAASRPPPSSTTSSMDGNSFNDPPLGSDSSTSTITTLLARIQNMEKAQLNFLKELQQLATTTAENHAAVDKRLTGVDSLSNAIVQRLKEHQQVAMLSLTTEFQGMFQGFLASFSEQSAAPIVHDRSAPPPPVAPTTDFKPPAANVAAFLPSEAAPFVSAPTDASRGSMASSVYSKGSLSSTRSYASDVQLPQQKKLRGTIQSEMSQLSLQPSSDV